MNNTASLLYKPGTDELMCQFYHIVSRETTIQNVSPILEQLRVNEGIDILLKSPNDTMARTCLRNYLQQNPHIPGEFYSKFIALITSKINLSPNQMTYNNQSYNARIILNNLRPPNRITNLTLNARKQQLLRDAANVTTHTYHPAVASPTIRMRFDHDLLKRCINALGDLHQTIQEGNRANDCLVDEYIRTNISK
jgi:hypothetical protein